MPGPGPKPRPALVLSVREFAGRSIAVVAYGTSQKVDQLYAGEFSIVSADRAAFEAAGLAVSTKFNLARIFALDYNDVWFGVAPGAPYGQSPKLGILHPTLVRRAKAAYDAATHRSLMNLSDLIDTYGYWAVFGWTLLEGESLLALAGLAAQQGYLDLHKVILVAIAGSFLGDQGWFFLGRYQGPKFLARHPNFAPRVARAHELLERYQTPLILGVRFLYGLRAVLPFVIGMSRISTLKFQVLNFIGAVIWSATIAGAGYLFGNAIEYIIGDIQRYEKYILAAVAVGVLVAWWISRRYPSRRRAKPSQL